MQVAELLRGGQLAVELADRRSSSSHDGVMFTQHDTETRRSLQNSASCAFERARMVLADRHEHRFGRGPPLRPPGRRDAACGGRDRGLCRSCRRA
jgi:hypothetical protein